MSDRRLPLVLSPLVLAVALVGLAPTLPAIGAVPVGVVGREISTSVDRSRVVSLPITASHVAVHWRDAPDANVSLAFSADGATFSGPEAVEHDDHGTAHGDRVFGGVIWAPGVRFVRVTSDRPVGDLRIVAIDAHAPTKSTAPASEHTVAAAVEQPAVISRAGWAANESLRFDQSGNELWPPEFYPTQKLTVHHTAGKNADPDPAATVRAIYYYDAVTKDWGDMGYNFLIDESGRIYEGRYSRAYDATEIPSGEDLNGYGVTGAHVGGYNAGTVGIALLGTLTNQDATAAARAALERLLAWKAERSSIDPLGEGLYTNPVSGAQKTNANISGHRDWAATECPGGNFYATFPSLRQAVAARISGTEPPAATVPGAPILTAKPPTTGKGVKLNWTAPADGGSGITAYNVLQVNNGSFVNIATVSGATLSYRDGTTKRGRTYTYVGRAVNAIGPGPYSNESSAVAR
ncbi:MAG: N-acetylmuramoyl-L-alanine amidase [Candidatus Limnocylindrales bacterium]